MHACTTRRLQAGPSPYLDVHIAWEMTTRGQACPFNPSPIVAGWLQDNHPFLPSSTAVTLFLQGQPRAGTSRAEQRRAAISMTIAADFRVVATSMLAASAVAHIRW